LVGVLVPNLANHYFYAPIKRMLNDAERDGYRLIVADSDEDLLAERELGLNLLAQTDGLILCSPRAPVHVLRRFIQRGKPVLVLGRAVDALPVSQVVVASYPAMRQLAVHVAELGHRRVVYLRGPLHSWESKERWRAVRTVARRGLDLTVIRVAATMEAGHRTVPRILAGGATAVLAYNDLAAIGVLAGLAERGVRVPEDISVTGYDDIPFSRYVTPALTTVRSPQEEVGSAAWKTMERLLRGARSGSPREAPGAGMCAARSGSPGEAPGAGMCADPPGTRTVLAAEPVLRASTGPPP
jgi:LacI family transcriptional regulator